MTWYSVKRPMTGGRNEERGGRERSVLAGVASVRVRKADLPEWER